MPRFGGLATMLRLPQASSAQGLDAAFIGVPRAFVARWPGSPGA